MLANSGQAASVRARRADAMLIPAADQELGGHGGQPDPDPDEMAMTKPLDATMRELYEVEPAFGSPSARSGQWSVKPG
jgi:hypothetical protein